MIFSFTVTTVVWAECEIIVDPDNPTIVKQRSFPIVPTTKCDTTNRSPHYTCEIIDSECDESRMLYKNAIGGYCHYQAGSPPTGSTCRDVIRITDTANSNVSTETTVTVIDCREGGFTRGLNSYYELCEYDPCVTFETRPYECDDILLNTPIYSWELNGEFVGTGDSFEFCPLYMDGGFLTAEDMVNNITDRQMIDVFSCETWQFEATFEGCGTLLIPWFGVVTIQGIDTIYGPFTTVSYDSPLIVKLPKLVNRRNQAITQFVILLPSLIFPAWSYPARVEVTVDGFSDTIVIPACGQ
jgi:hypothetical protein